MSFRAFTSSRDDSTSSAAKTAAPLPAMPVTAAATRSEVYIGKGSQVRGSLTFTGPAEVDCQVEGEIEAQDRFVIGESAMIQASKIRGVDITIKGTVQANDISASKRLCLKKPAKVVGNLTAPILIIEEGVLFEGKCTMGMMEASSDKSKGVVQLKSLS